RARFVAVLGLTPYAASVLTAHPRISDFFEEASKLAGDAVKVANFIQTELLRNVMTSGLSANFPVSPEQVAELLQLVDEKAISGKQAKEVYAKIAGTTTSPRAIVEQSGVSQLSDPEELEAICVRVIEKSPKQAKGYRGGKTALLGYFVGQV